MKIDLALILRLFLFFIAIVALIMAYLATEDAGKLCLEFCRAKYHTEYFSYRIGSCKCQLTQNIISSRLYFNDIKIFWHISTYEENREKGSIS